MALEALFAKFWPSNLPGLNSNLWGNTTHALTEEGTLWGWGWNDEGLVGNGKKENLFKREPVRIMNDVKDVQVYDCLYIALKKDGSLYIWGEVDDILGYVPWSQSKPVLLLEDVIEYSADTGGEGLLMKKSDGTVWAWGSLGAVNNYKKAQKVMDSGAILTPDNMRFILDQDRNLWKIDDPANLMNPDRKKCNILPQKILENVVGFSSYGFGHYEPINLAFTADGSLWQWGDVGVYNGHSVTEVIPVKVMEGAKAVSVSRGFVFVITEADELWTWGEWVKGFNHRHPIPVQVLPHKGK